MAWITMGKSNDGKFEISANYTVTSNTSGNYSDVKITQIRYKQLTNAYYFWNNYPTNDGRCAIIGRTINGHSKDKKITMGYVVGQNKINQTRTFDFNMEAVRINHNSSGAATFAIGVWADTKTGYGNCNLTKYNISLPKLDRTAATITCPSIAVYRNSIAFTIGTNKELSNLQYQINGGSWVKMANSNLKANTSKTFTISNLRPNTKYTIHWKGATKSNGIFSNGIGTVKTTAVNAPTVKSIIANQVTNNTIKFSITGAPDQNDSIYQYTYSLNNTDSWRAWQTSNSFSLSNLKSRTRYTIYARVKSKAGATSNYKSIVITTTSKSPTMTDFTVEPRRNFINVYIEKYSTDNVGVKQFNYKLYDSSNNLLESKSSVMSNYTFRNLKYNTQYKVTIELITEEGKKVSVTRTVTTHKDLIAPTLTRSSTDTTKMTFKLSTITSYNSPIKSVTFIVDGVKKKTYSELQNSYIVDGLKPNTTYSIYAEIKDNKNYVVSTNTLKVSTWTLPPSDLKIIFDYIKPTSIKFHSTVKTNNSTIKEYRYSINKKGSTDFIFKDELCSAGGDISNIVDQLIKPNTTYTFKLVCYDTHNRQTSAVKDFTTPEDKWVQVSINGSDFIKADFYFVFSNGIVRKVPKSKRQIII